MQRVWQRGRRSKVVSRTLRRTAEEILPVDSRLRPRVPAIGVAGLQTAGRLLSSARLKPRRGVAVLVVLLVVIVVFVGTAAFGRWIMHGHKLSRIHQQQLQANALAESGLERAIRKFQEDNSFAGDSWNVTQPLSRPGIVNTKIARDDNAITVETIALYPSDSQLPRRAVRSLRIDSSQPRVSSTESEVE